jgi:hypothetical protein
MTTSKTAEAEKPVLYYTGTGSKPPLPERDLYAADLRKRSKEALIATGFYSESKPKARS